MLSRMMLVTSENTWLMLSAANFSAKKVFEILLSSRISTKKSEGFKSDDHEGQDA